MRIWSQPSFLRKIQLFFPERSAILRTMNNTFDDFDTQIQPEEYYEQPEPPTGFLVMMWLTMQSLQVKVWNN